MRTDSGIERSEGTPTPWPWTLSSIRTVVAEAAEYGFRLGIREPALAVAAGKGEVERSELPDAQYEALEETVESLAAAAEIRFDDAWEEEVAGWIEFAIEAAVVLGLRACGKVRVDAALTDHERVQRADWFTSTVDDVLAKLIESLVASGHPVPHSQEFLDRHHGAGGDVRTFLAPREDAAREVRTAWIRDHDSGRLYQWCVLRDDARLLISRRSCGERSVAPGISLRAAEAELVGRLLVQAAEGWQDA